MQLLSFLAAAALAIPSVAKACDLALLLAVDVSGSIDAKEYRMQMDGLAAGLRDGLVVEALVAQKAAVALIQWTGEGRQHLSVPWTTVRSGVDAIGFADLVENTPRQWSHYSTAIGDALLASAEVMEAGPDCKRKVLDISGDGVSNEGSPVKHGRIRLKEMGVTVNAVVIETDETDLTAYFWENVITGIGAFVVTAEGFEDYPERIRQKLIREVAKQLSDVPHMSQQITGAL
jgi:Ca-activated chloride channel family protein